MTPRKGFVSIAENVNLETASVTLTFEVGKWILDVAHHHDMVDICAKLF
jgi:hypothetical protein